MCMEQNGTFWDTGKRYYQLPGSFGTEVRSWVVAFPLNFRAKGRDVTKCLKMSHLKKVSSRPRLQVSFHCIAQLRRATKSGCAQCNETKRCHVEDRTGVAVLRGAAWVCLWAGVTPLGVVQVSNLSEPKAW